MKQRETNLISIVKQMYRLSSSPKLDKNSLNTAQYKELMSVYKALGGRLDDIPIRFGAWDIVTDGFIIELDEEQHFNRYRAQTLKSSLYEKWPYFDVESYKNYCIKFEDICLKKAKRGGYWSNSSTENQFGPAGDNGTFSGNGSPRWKQRAFYDYCRDLYSCVSRMPVYRFSIYDAINTNGQQINLGDALLLCNEDAVVEYLKVKINRP